MRNSLMTMVGRGRFELPTNWLKGLCKIATNFLKYITGCVLLCPKHCATIKQLSLGILIVSSLCFGQAHAFTEQSEMFVEGCTECAFRQAPPAPNWHHPGYAASFDLSDSYARVGFAYDRDVMLSVFSLGCYSTDALGTPDEEKLMAGQCTAETCAPPDRYLTSGCVGGAALTKTYRFGVLSIEGGPTLNIQSFHLQAGAHKNHDVTQYWRGPFTHDEVQAGIGGMVGIRVSDGDLSLMAYYYAHQASSRFKDGEFPSEIKHSFIGHIRYAF